MSIYVNIVNFLGVCDGLKLVSHSHLLVAYHELDIHLTQMISIIKKLSRCTCIILLITWLISVFVAVHSSPGARLSTARNSSRESLAGRVYVSRELCQPPHVSCSLVVSLLTGQVVTASTHVNELAPVEGLVTPDTKTKKAVYIDASYFNFMLYAVIPRYNCEGVAF